jgi:hypothetical protein
MQIQEEAEENLRVIRSLMEKATIYRAISAPTALVGGLCSVIFGGWLFACGRSLPAISFDRLFCFGWLGVLAVTVCANALFIWLAAQRRGEPFISPAMRKALWALFPPMLCGAVLTFGYMAKYDSPPVDLAPMWMLFYGLGLLATAQFAPKSIPLLGWCFLVVGLGIGSRLVSRPGFVVPELDADFLMVGTFGLFHLIYAACTWPRRSAAVQPNEAA